jgi:hypothetical protein
MMAARATTRKLATRVIRKAPRRNSVTWEDDDVSLVSQAQTSRSAEELARLHKYAVSHRDAKLKAAVAKRAKDLGIKPTELKWNPAKLRRGSWVQRKSDGKVGKVTIVWDRVIDDGPNGPERLVTYEVEYQDGERSKTFPEYLKPYKGKKNPASASAEVFEDFHGHEPSEVVTVTKKVHHHAHLAALGRLVSLDVWGVDNQGHKISGFKKALLCSNEDRNQLFIEGGDQAVNLRDFGIKSAHEVETLGQVTEIAYHTNKSHLGDEGGEAVYVHRFRSTNENGKHVMVKMTREPDLVYDVRNEQLLFSGGSYEILREGIDK